MLQSAKEAKERESELTPRRRVLVAEITRHLDVDAGVCLECWDHLNTAQYDSTELAEIPGYSCSASTTSKDFSWSGETQDSAGANIDTLRFSSLMHDNCCDYSYLYMFEFWVR